MPVIDLRPIRKMTHDGNDFARLYVGDTLVYDFAARVTIAETEGIGTDGHSLLATAVGDPPAWDDGDTLIDLWTGDIHNQFIGGSYLSTRWDALGPARTETYSGAMIVTEMFDFDNDLTFADPASAQGQETLQYLYWFCLTAQVKGCKLFGIYCSWNYQGSPASLDDEMMQKAQYWRQWLQARPEITIPVYLIPTPYFIRQAITINADHATGWNIFADVIHINGWQEVNTGLAAMVKMFLTGEKVADDAGRSAILQDYIDAAWDILTTYECTGLGSTVIAAWPVASDPLPSPTPLPSRPAQPGAPTISAITDTGATPSWTPPADGGSPITSYTLEWRPAGGSITTITGIEGTSQPLTGLTAVSPYQARVTAINDLGASDPSPWADFSTVAASTGPAVSLELARAGYTGPALSSGAWPAPVDGIRTIAAGDPAPISIPISMAGDGYAIVAVRRAAFSGSIAILSFNGGNYGSSPWWSLNCNGSESRWNTALITSTGEAALSPTFISSAWVVVEVLKVDGVVSISVGGESDTSSVSVGAGPHATSMLHLFRDEGSEGAAVEFVAIRVLDGIPDAAGRAEQRAWAGREITGESHP